MYLHETNVEVPCAVPSFQVPAYISIIVPHNLCNDVRGADALGPLYGVETLCLFHFVVYICRVSMLVRGTVLYHKVYLCSTKKKKKDLEMPTDILKPLVFL